MSIQDSFLQINSIKPLRKSLCEQHGRRYNTLHSVMKRIILLASSCLFVFGLQVFSQDVPQNWVRIESKARDFSVALPEGEFLVDHDGTKSEMWHLRPGGLISPQVPQTRSPWRGVRVGSAGATFGG